ncbi:hypothetical protein E2C01_097148 [Portunus trituberculatus]|uniref:Uncharacterized protein n=1 Tax=Portunus trituberculatus TaxID=210409 RepID=A0A5B7K4Z0_PORTR|nr:hypothetical protein [Portunus trituberculatus]
MTAHFKQCIFVFYLYLRESAISTHEEPFRRNRSQDSEPIPSKAFYRTVGTGSRTDSCPALP